MSQSFCQTLSGTSPAAASTAVGSLLANGLSRWDSFTVTAALVGATGGTLDVYLQRKLDTDVWVDWIHFPQLADGAAAVKYVVVPGPNNTIVVTGIGSDASPGVALAANTCAGGHPGDSVRVVLVAGVGTSAGAAYSVRIYCQRGIK